MLNALPRVGKHYNDVVPSAIFGGLLNEIGLKECLYELAGALVHLSLKVMRHLWFGWLWGNVNPLLSGRHTLLPEVLPLLSLAALLKPSCWSLQDIFTCFPDLPDVLKEPVKT
jgi:hypothetical protein